MKHENGLLTVKQTGKLTLTSQFACLSVRSLFYLLKLIFSHFQAHKMLNDVNRWIQSLSVLRDKLTEKYNCVYASHKKQPKF